MRNVQGLKQVWNLNYVISIELEYYISIPKLRDLPENVSFM
jgi:hypothetical protein